MNYCQRDSETKQEKSKLYTDKPCGAKKPTFDLERAKTPDHVCKGVYTIIICLGSTSVLSDKFPGFHSADITLRTTKPVSN